MKIEPPLPLPSPLLPPPVSPSGDLQARRREWAVKLYSAACRLVGGTYQHVPPPPCLSLSWCLVTRCGAVLIVVAVVVLGFVWVFWWWFCFFTFFFTIFVTVDVESDLILLPFLLWRSQLNEGGCFRTVDVAPAPALADPFLDTCPGEGSPQGCHSPPTARSRPGTCPGMQRLMPMAAHTCPALPPSCR